MSPSARHPLLLHPAVRRRVLLCAVLCCVLVAVPHGGQTAPANNAGKAPSLASSLAHRRFSATRLFIGPVSERDAALAAETAARAKAMQSVVRALAALPEVRISGLVGPGRTASPNLLALARATAKTSVLLAGKSRKPPSVTITVTLLSDEDAPPMETRVRDALMHPDRLDLYEKAILREKKLLDAFDALVPPTASFAGAPPSLPRFPVQVSKDAVKNIVNEIKALSIFETVLPSRDGLWKDPAAVRDAMQTALALAPGSTLCRNALGDALLQLGRSQEALEEQTRAIRADPSFARAFHSRGTASLALGHLSSAVADFSEAIRFSPDTASYYRSRGMARHLLGETRAMCDDLYQACVRGECDALQWGVSHNYCSVPHAFDAR